MKDVNELIDKYFRGETTREEEKQLRKYFTEETPTGDLAKIAPIFTYFSEEESVTEFLKELRVEKTVVKRNISKRIPFLKIASMAACLLLGVLLLNKIVSIDRMSSENCVWVNGEKITSIAMVRKYAETSFENVKSEENMLEQQLRLMGE